MVPSAQTCALSRSGEIRILDSTGLGEQFDMGTIRILARTPGTSQARAASWLRQMLDAAHGEVWSERMLNGELTLARNVGSLTRGLPVADRD